MATHHRLSVQSTINHAEAATKVETEVANKATGATKAIVVVDNRQKGGQNSKVRC